jgi:transporter family-2 protein
MDKLLWIVLAFIAGALLPVQAGVNAKLGKAAESPMHAVFISFLVGALGVFVYLLLTKQSISMSGLKSAPAYAWVGGLLGAFYVAVVILAFPHLGPGLTFAFIVTGQMLFTVVLEHFNILVANPHPINVPRFIGLLLVIVGAIIIRKF